MAVLGLLLPSAKQHWKIFLCRYIPLNIHNPKDKEKIIKAERKKNPKLPAREQNQTDLRFLITNSGC